MLRAALVLSVLAGGCTAELAPCHVRCSPEGTCPIGAVCGGDGFCHTDPGETCDTAVGRDGSPAEPDPDADLDAGADVVNLDLDWRGSGGGNVLSAPAGLDCSGSCERALPRGTSIRLIAAPSGSTFMGWSGTCTGVGECSLVLDADAQVAAAFVSGSGACTQPFGLDARGGTYVNTMTGSGTDTHSCAGSSGNDRSFSITPSTTGMMRVQVTTDYWPASVYITAGCSDTQFSCVSAPGPWPVFDFQVNVTAGTTYQLVLGHGSYNGPIAITHTLTVTPP